MSNKVDNLRAILFETIDAVRKGDMPLDRAKTVAELTQVVVNSARVEVDFIRATNGKGIGSGFLGEQPNGTPELPEPAAKQTEPGAPAAPASDLPSGITGIHRHLIRDDDEPARGAQ